MSNSPARHARPPTFILSDLRRAIPKHCFHVSYVRSFRFLLRDLCLAALAYYAATYIAAVRVPATCIGHASMTAGLQTVCWLCYWLLQGSIFFGMWVIGHESGHGSFTPSTLVNDVVGSLLHTLLLTPYFGWKYSHAKHHQYTNHLRLDEVFVPDVVQPAHGVQQHQDDHSEAHELLQELRSSMQRLWSILLMCTIAWPAYLLFNFRGHSSYSAHRRVNHFEPSSPLFNANQYYQVLSSDVLLAGWLYALYVCARVYGVASLLCYYLLPLSVCIAWLAVVTFLHHTHEQLPRYDHSEWQWLRGALGTIDYNYGRLLNSLHHHIGDTHLLHHLFSRVPFYHAVEATQAIKRVLGDDYAISDSAGVTSSLWQQYGRCNAVSEGQQQKGVYWF